MAIAQHDEPGGLGEPSHMSPMSSVTIPHARSSVSAARHALADELTANGIPARMRDDAVLVLSELVSNAIRHAEPLPTGDIRVRWSLRRDLLHLEITDGGALTRPQAAAAASSSLGGRGLNIVRTICSEWGVTEDGSAVTVWADLRRPGVA
jgi:anti-sigma regulatory factor (Ser/Thr protein kinase)